MKKIVLVFTFIVFFFFGFRQDWAFFDQEEDFTIFSDPHFSQPSHSFNPGDKIYVRIKTIIDGEKEKRLRLLDAEKKTLETLILAKSGQNPFIYSLSFAAPIDPGIYYLDIKIRDGQGSVYASQSNINVGRASGQAVSSEAIAIAESGESQAEAVSETTVQETVLPSATPALTSAPAMAQDFISQIIAKIFSFFRKIFSFSFRP